MSLEGDRFAHERDTAARETAKGEAETQRESAGNDAMTKIAERLEQMAEELTAPREIVRGPDGRATGVKVGSRLRQIKRGDDGRAVGII
jgi:hypothetical protein